MAVVAVVTESVSDLHLTMGSFERLAVAMFGFLQTRTGTRELLSMVNDFVDNGESTITAVASASRLPVRDGCSLGRENVNMSIVGNAAQACALCGVVCVCVI